MEDRVTLYWTKELAVVPHLRLVVSLLVMSVSLVAMPAESRKRNISLLLFDLLLFQVVILKNTQNMTLMQLVFFVMALVMNTENSQHFYLI